MNPLLEQKLSALKKAQEFECWYLVKHSTNFAHLCYLVSFLKDYVDHPGASRNLESHIDKKVSALNSSKPDLKLSNNYRALRVAAFFGLIKMKSSNYSECVFTDTYAEIVARCQGEFEKTELYQDIITRQIEKMYVASSIDEGKTGTRKDYNIFPIMFLNKILVEIGKVTGSYSISMNEYRYLVATTKRFDAYLETMLYIKLLRDEANSPYNGSTVLEEFKTLRDKFDNRMNKAIELLEYIDCSNDRVSLKPEYIDAVAKKVYDFESTSHTMSDEEYIDFLCSTKSFFDITTSAEDGDLSTSEKAIVDKFSPEWFNEKAKEFAAEDAEATALYADFESKFGIAALQALSGEDLLKAMFLGGSTDNLCHELEYVKRVNDLFGSCKGGSVYKYPLFFDKETSTWMTGTRLNPVALSLNEAIIKGTAIRDGLAQAANIFETTVLGSVEDYLALYTKVYSVIPDIVDGLWVSKYFHMLFPQVLPVFYNKDWQIKVLTVLNLIPSDATYGRMGQINEFVKKCNISNVVFAQIFYKYCRNVELEPDEESGADAISATRIKGGENIILYGVPGAGKSWTIKNEYCDDESCMERLVFHPDYTYSDFVGQIMPKVTGEGTVSYEFSPGPFAKLVKKAYANPDKMFYLIIEEVNRGNAPAIFGDVFQLLDRQSRLIPDKSTGKLVENDNYGASEYEITNADVARVVYGNENHKVSIPSNMSILCTMNTSDQNVFTLDTAFQRRWSMRLIQNQFPEDGSEKAFADTHILDTDVTWEKFFTVINDLILGKNIRMTSAEDKRLGTHFVSQEDLILDDYSGDDKDLIKQAIRQNRKFAEKVLKYLWDDAFKFNKDEIFDISKVNSLEKVISVFVAATGNARFEGIFKTNIYDALVPKQ